MKAKKREEPGEEQGRDAENEQPLIADGGHAQVEDPAQLGRHPQIVAAGDGEQARLKECGESKGEHEIERTLRPTPEPPLERGDQERVDAQPEQERPHRRTENACDARQMKQHDGSEGQIAADGEELAVGDIDHIEHTKDQAEADGEERVEPTQNHALDEELDKRFKHGSQGVPPPRRGRG